MVYIIALPCRKANSVMHVCAGHFGVEFGIFVSFRVHFVLNVLCFLPCVTVGGLKLGATGATGLGGAAAGTYRDIILSLAACRQREPGV